MSSETNKIFDTIANAASEVIDEAKDVAQSASKVVAGRYGTVKLHFELSQLQDAQHNIFAQIGHTLFLIHSGAVNIDALQNGENSVPPQNLIDDLLLEAAKLDAQIDIIGAQLANTQNKKLCPKCKKSCAQNEVYCSDCGNKL